MGEWQRIALARTFYRNAELYLFDEPTSAMDAWAEVAWVKRLPELLRGKTALIITHRLIAAMHADIICVMSEGRILEMGTHNELIAQGGLYAYSWNSQSGRLMAPRNSLISFGASLRP